MIRNFTAKKVIIMTAFGKKLVLPPEGPIEFVEEIESFTTNDGVKVESNHGMKPINLPREAKNTLFIVDEKVKCHCFEREDFVTLPSDAKPTEVGDSIVCDRLIL